MKIVVFYQNKYLDILGKAIRPYTLSGIKENPSKLIGTIITLSILAIFICKSKNPNMTIFCYICSSLFGKLAKLIIH